MISKHDSGKTVSKYLTARIITDTCNLAIVFSTPLVNCNQLIKT